MKTFTLEDDQWHALLALVAASAFSQAQELLPLLTQAQTVPRRYTFALTAGTVLGRIVPIGGKKEEGGK
jgi:hypothetical protein